MKHSIGKSPRFAPVLSALFGVSLAATMVPTPSLAKHGHDSRPNQAQMVSQRISPQTVDDFIKLVGETQTGMFNVDELRDAASRFRYLGQHIGAAGAKGDVLALSMLQQWVYLESFVCRRAEYLLQVFVQTAGIAAWVGRAPGSVPSDSEISAVESEFRRLFPPDVWPRCARFHNNREPSLNQLKTYLASPTEAQTNIDFLVGSLQGALMSMVVVEAQRAQLTKRYKSDDPRRRREEIELTQREQAITASSALLADESIQDLATRYRGIIFESNRLKEVAVASHLEAVRKHVPESAPLTDFVDFLSRGHLERLGTDLASILARPEQIELRNALTALFPQAYDAIRARQVSTIEALRASYERFDTIQEIALLNAQSANIQKGFRNWLLHTFKELPVHMSLTHDFPHLERGARELINFAAAEASRQSWNQASIMGMSMALYLVNGLGLPSKAPAVIGKAARFLFYSALGSAVAYSGYTAYETYAQYLELSELSRLNPNGQSLASVIQALQMRTSLLWDIGGLGASLAQLGITWRRFVFNPPPGGFSHVPDLARNMWNGNYDAVPMLRDYFSGMGKAAAGMTTAMKQLKVHDHGPHFRAFAGEYVPHFRSFTGNATTFLTHLSVAPFASMPWPAKKFLASVPSAVYVAAWTGTMLQVLSVTVQHKLTAGVLHAMTVAFEQLNWPIEAFWRTNALNMGEKSTRDAYDRANLEVLLAIRDITEQIQSIHVAKFLLRDANLPEDERRKMNALLLQWDKVVQQSVKLLLTHWYVFREWRGIYNTLFAREGFHMLAHPDWEHPAEVTMYYTIGDEIVISSKISAAEIEEIKSQTDPIPHTSPNDALNAFRLMTHIGDAFRTDDKKAPVIDGSGNIRQDLRRKAE